MKEVKIMKQYLEIENLRIGPDYPPVVIAEIGINHNGSLKVAFEMVDAAKKGGAHIVKHQTHIVEDEMSSEAKKVIPGNATISIYEIMENAALSEEDEYKLKEYVEKQGMIFLSTPFSRAAANRLEKFGVPAYKIGSGEMNNYPLIEHIASFGKPMIVSTGMNDIASVSKTVEILEKYNVPYALLHTTNLYPTPAALVRLGAMQELIEKFPRAVVGLSDHTVNNNACLAAVALGACILERHFTDSMSRKGPDIVNSMTPAECLALVEGSSEIWQMRGGEKVAAIEEQVTIDFAFATVVTIADIAAGEELTLDNIWVKRPAVGEIFAKEFPNILGKKAKHNIKADTHLKWSDFI